MRSGWEAGCGGFRGGLFGNEGGFFALGLYCFCPAVVRSAVTPNNDVLAMWGLYGLVYAAMGVAHAMQGPRSKWKPRIVLLTVALGLTAAAHLLAAMIGFVMAMVWMMYLSERRRSYVMQILVFSAVGALAILFGFYAFRLAPFSYVFTGGSARFWFALDSARHFFLNMANGPIVVATLVALAALCGGATLPLLRQYGAIGDGAAAVSAGDDADGFEAVALGAAVSVYVCGWGVRGCAGDAAAEVVSWPVRRDPRGAGDVLHDGAAGDRAIAAANRCIRVGTR